MKHFNLTLEDDIRYQFKLACAYEDKDMRTVARQLILEYIQKIEQKRKRKKK